MSWWAHVWERLKGVPLGLWAALGVGLTILGLYLRGRRLEAELGRAKLGEQAAAAKADASRNAGRAEAHLETADLHAARAQELSEKVDKIREAGSKEAQRLAALPPDKITAEYLKLAERKKAEL